MQPHAIDRGAKHTCPACSTKFYDLRKPQIVCPRCGVNVLEALAKQKTSGSKSRSRPKPAPVVVKPVEPEDDAAAEEVEDEDEEEDLDDES